MNGMEQSTRRPEDGDLPVSTETLSARGKKKGASSGQHCWMLLLALLLVVSCLASTADASSIANPSFGLIRSRRSFLHSNSYYPASKTGLQQQHSSRSNRSSNIISNLIKRKTTTTTTKTKLTTPDSFWYYIKVALAGGIAGAVGSTALYPMDAAKTLRQSSPSEYASVFHALAKLVYTRTTTHAAGAAGTTKITWHVQRVYRGVIPAAVGAIPSSALYFGAYESMKALLKRRFPLEGENNDNGKKSLAAKNVAVTVRKNNFRNRLLVHALAAMSGNVLSSAVFVPKELIKQQLQYRQSGNVLGVVVDIVTTKGLSGLYVGYKATLMRNIPTAVLRFSLYEEFRYRWTKNAGGAGADLESGSQGPKFFLAGAAAGVLASGVMTPVDVLKTRLATGTCPVDVKNCFLWVIKEEGIAGLYSGAGSRMIFSGAFSAIGFGTFEWAKGVLGVATTTTTTTKASSSKTASSSKNKANVVACGQKQESKAQGRSNKTKKRELEPRTNKQSATKLIAARQ